MDIIKFDFESGEIYVEDHDLAGTIMDPNLKKKKAAILAAACLREEKTEELADDIDRLFDDLGLPCRAARPNGRK